MRGQHLTLWEEAIVENGMKLPETYVYKAPFSEQAKEPILPK